MWQERYLGAQDKLNGFLLPAAKEEKKGFLVNADYIKVDLEKRYNPGEIYAKRLVDDLGPPRKDEELSEPYDYGNFSHRLLGHPDYIQLGDTRYMLALDHDTEGRFISDGFGNYTNPAEFVAEARRWRLLAQFTGDEHARMSWGNGGMIYFWIREEDLAARRFDQVYGELVST